jgi:hypothetical protein
MDIKGQVSKEHVESMLTTISRTGFFIRYTSYLFLKDTYFKLS